MCVALYLIAYSNSDIELNISDLNFKQTALSQKNGEKKKDNKNWK